MGASCKESGKGLGRREVCGRAVGWWEYEIKQNIE